MWQWLKIMLFTVSLLHIEHCIMHKNSNHKYQWDTNLMITLTVFFLERMKKSEIKKVAYWPLVSVERPTCWHSPPSPLTYKLAPHVLEQETYLGFLFCGGGTHVSCKNSICFCTWFEGNFVESGCYSVYLVLILFMFFDIVTLWCWNAEYAILWGKFSQWLSKDGNFLSWVHGRKRKDRKMVPKYSQW
jgi:hypothetical protein